jgi:hypothetical protein
MLVPGNTPFANRTEALGSLALSCSPQVPSVPALNPPKSQTPIYKPFHQPLSLVQTQPLFALSARQLCLFPFHRSVAASGTSFFTDANFFAEAVARLFFVEGQIGRAGDGAVAGVSRRGSCQPVFRWLRGVDCCFEKEAGRCEKKG